MKAIKTQMELYEKATILDAKNTYENELIANQFYSEENEELEALANTMLDLYIKINSIKSDTDIKVVETFAGACPVLKGVIKNSHGHKNIKTIAIDYSDYASKLVETKYPYIDFINKDVCDKSIIKDIGKNTVDMIMSGHCSFGYLNMYNAKEHLKLMSKILKPGGIYFICLGDMLQCDDGVSRDNYLEWNLEEEENKFLNCKLVSTDFVKDEDFNSSTKTHVYAWALQDFSKVWLSEHIFTIHNPIYYDVWKSELGFSEVVSVCKDYNEDICTVDIKDLDDLGVIGLIK